MYVCMCYRRLQGFLTRLDPQVPYMGQFMGNEKFHVHAGKNESLRAVGNGMYQFNHNCTLPCTSGSAVSTGATGVMLCEYYTSDIVVVL